MRTHDQTLKEMNDNRLLFEQIVEHYPEPAISHRPGEHNWSIKEILGHLADIQELVLVRVNKMLAEENPLDRALRRRAGESRARPPQRRHGIGESKFRKRCVRS